MANIRIKDLPADSAPKADDKVPIDLGTTRNTTVEEFVFAGRPTATKTEAEAGTDNKKAMTPLAVKQAIDAQTGMRYVPVTRRVDSGTGLSGGQELTGDVTLSLNAASVASLAKADSAVQSVNGKSGNSVTITPADVGAAPSSIVADVNANTAERHSHTNKAILDATTASFLAAEKTKLSGIESGAQVNTVTSVAGKTGAVTLSAADASAAPDTLVPDINANTTARHTHSNKAILDATTASFLAAEKTKLAGIAAGAQVNTVTSVAGKTGAVALVKADVGLGNVDNTSDLNKPISTATQGAIDGKYDVPAGTTAQYIRGDGSLSTFPSIPQGTVTSVGLTVPTGLSASGSPVTSSGTIAVSYATGYQGYTSAEASKLGGIAAGAQVNTVNSVNTKTGAVVLNASDVGAAPDTVVADINANTADRHTHSNKAILDATTSSFLAADKTKLTGIEAGAQVNTVTSVSGKTGAVTLVKADVGLGNVDNTSDASKPVSTATQTALNAKANSSVTVSAGTGLTGGGNLTANRSVALNSASIASLGKADTALQAPGGTTGQILAKNSNTTNDVGWVSSEAATAVSYGPQTLTGAQKTQAKTNLDLQNVPNKSEAQMVASGAIADALGGKLGTGAKAADSSLLNGQTAAQLPISMATQTSLDTKQSYNWIINGDFIVNQRSGVKKPANGVYGFDRWKGNANGIEQIVESLPSGEYTLTWSGGGNGTFGGQTKSSPIKATVTAGNTSVVVPESATKVSLVAGDATASDPWNYCVRPIGVEVNLCRRYHQVIGTGWMYPIADPASATFRRFFVQLVPTMRASPSATGTITNTTGYTLFFQQPSPSSIVAAVDGLPAGTFIEFNARFDAEL